MKKTTFFALALSLIIAMPMFLSADEEEVEIQLYEVMGAGMLPESDPLDGNITIPSISTTTNKAIS